MTENRCLFAWGDNTHGQLGVDDLESTSVPVQVHKKLHWVTITAGKGTSAGMTTRGEAVIWGDNRKGQQFQAAAGRPTVVQLGHLFKPGERVELIGVSEDHSAVVSTDNSAYLTSAGRMLIVHVPKQFGLNSLVAVSLLPDGLYLLGNNGDLFYLPYTLIALKKEHYLASVVHRNFTWISGGPVSIVAGGRQGEMYEVQEGSVRRVTAAGDVLTGGTNSNVYAAVMPCKRRPALVRREGLLDLSEISQYTLLESMVRA